MDREVSFTMREMTRCGVIQTVLEKKMTTLEAAAALHLSARQIKRIKKKIHQLGPTGVRHGNRGRRPLHAFCVKLKQQVVHPGQNRDYE